MNQAIMKKYITLSARTVHELDKVVNEKLENGYVLYGSPYNETIQSEVQNTQNPHHIYRYKSMFYQAVVVDSQKIDENFLNSRGYEIKRR